MHVKCVELMLLLAGPVPPSPAPSLPPSLASSRWSPTPLPSQSEKRPSPGDGRVQKASERPSAADWRRSSSSVCPSSSCPLPSSQTFDPWLPPGKSGTKERTSRNPAAGVLHRRWPPPEDMRRRLEAFLMVTTQEGGAWHPVGGGQEVTAHPAVHGTVPIPQDDPSHVVSRAQLEKPAPHGAGCRPADLLQVEASGFPHLHSVLR